MTKNHIKALATPKTWSIKRKKTVYVTRPNSSGQKMEFTMSLNMVFKDLLKFCKTTKEVKKVLQDNDVQVDGKKMHDPRETMGFMSVLSIAETKESYRMIISKKGNLELKKLDKKESDIKPVVIKKKTTLAKDKVQLNMSDGRNILIKKNDYKTGDALVITLPKQEIKDHIKLDKGTYITLTGGKHIGISGLVEEIDGNTIKFKGEDGKVHETRKIYAYPLGVKKAVIDI